MRYLDRHGDPIGPLTKGQPPKWLRLTDPLAEGFGD